MISHLNESVICSPHIWGWADFYWTTALAVGLMSRASPCRSCPQSWPGEQGLCLRLLPHHLIISYFNTTEYWALHLPSHPWYFMALSSSLRHTDLPSQQDWEGREVFPENRGSWECCRNHGRGVITMSALICNGRLGTNSSELNQSLG